MLEYQKCSTHAHTSTDLQEPRKYYNILDMGKSSWRFPH